MADRVQQLLDYIVRRYVVVDDQKDIDLNAPAGGGDTQNEKAEVARREMERAADLREPFRDGLGRAYRARLAGQSEIALDDRDPDQNRMADALIQILVAHGLAESRSEPTEPAHYVYSIAVAWDTLTAVARDAGVDLEPALRELAG